MSASKGKVDKSVRPPNQPSLANIWAKAARPTPAAAQPSGAPASAAAAAPASSNRAAPAHDAASLRTRVVHRTDKYEFELRVPGISERAFLSYDYVAAGGGSQAMLIDLQHTSVPQAAQGQGVAGFLVEEAFLHAEKAHMQVRPSCSYIKTFLQKNPKWLSHVETRADNGAGGAASHRGSHDNRGRGAGGDVSGKTFHKQGHQGGGNHSAAANHSQHHTRNQHGNQHGSESLAPPIVPMDESSDNPHSGDKRRSPSNFDEGVSAEWRLKRGKVEGDASAGEESGEVVRRPEPVRGQHHAQGARHNVSLSAAASNPDSSAAAASTSARPASAAPAPATKPAPHIPPGYVPLPFNPQFAKKWGMTLAVISEVIDAPGGAASSAAAASARPEWGTVAAAVDVMSRLSLSKKELELRCLGMKYFFEVYIEDDAQRKLYLTRTLPFLLRLIRDLPRSFDVLSPENSNLKGLPPACVPTLRTGVESTLNLTKIQLVSLLAASYFGLQVEHIPRAGAGGGEVRQFKSSNFDGLWLSVGRTIRHAQGTNDTPDEIRSDPQSEVEKLKCLMVYFERMRERVLKAEDPSNPECERSKVILQGIVTFHRKVLQLKRADMERRILGSGSPLFKSATAAGAGGGAAAAAGGASSAAPQSVSASLPLCQTELREKGTIEDDGYGTMQIDFANKFLGGGVLTRGCVQEEIRLTICPESLVGLLFVEVMDERESVTIIGCERFVDYEGYSRSFRCAGPHLDPTPIDPATNRMKTVLVAIDAISYRPRNAQFKREMILREILKAYSGFSLEDSVLGVTGSNHSASSGEAKGAVTTYVLPSEGGGATIKPDVTEAKYDFLQIATGNWGCGAFGGEIPLKCMIQLIAATLSHRSLRYFTFASDECKPLPALLELLESRKVTVRDLYSKVLMHYHPMKQRDRTTAEYVRDLLDGVDEKRQQESRAEEQRQQRLAAVQRRLDQQHLFDSNKPGFARQAGPAAASSSAAGRHVTAADDVDSLDAVMGEDCDDPIEDFPSDDDALAAAALDDEPEYDSEAERAVREAQDME